MAGKLAPSRSVSGEILADTRIGCTGLKSPIRLQDQGALKEDGNIPPAVLLMAGAVLQKKW